MDKTFFLIAGGVIVIGAVATGEIVAAVHFIWKFW